MRRSRSCLLGTGCFLTAATAVNLSFLSSCWVPTCQLRFSSSSVPENDLASWSEEYTEDRGKAQHAISACFAATLALLVLISSPRSAIAVVSEEIPDGNPIAVDLRIPQLPEDEVRRRRTTSSDLIKSETWYKQGKRIFSSSCGGCHPISRYATSKRGELLSKEYFESHGGLDEARMQYSIRYGKGSMPGYAIDCADLNDNYQAVCNSIVPLSEEKLRDLQDFLYNRMNAKWEEP